MNLSHLAGPMIVLLLANQSFAEVQEIDTELSKLAERLAAPIKENGKKKVTVLDFTDLQGGSSELGRYIAEQLTVDLVMAKRDFSVLDRANLKSILAEHKLTSQGLVDPDNAKKLGQFAGVDALILGTLTPKDQMISFTAKVITTDTAEIVAASKGEFKTEPTVQKLLSRATKVDSGSTSGETPPPKATAPRKLFGDLQADVESFRLSKEANLYGFGVLTLTVTNASDSVTYGLAFKPDPHHDIDFRNNRQDWFEVVELNGVNTAFSRDGAYYGSFTEIPPLTAIRVVAKTQVRWSGKPGDYRPYRFQTVVAYGTESQGRITDIKDYNLIIDLK